MISFSSWWGGKSRWLQNTTLATPPLNPLRLQTTQTSSPFAVNSLWTWSFAFSSLREQKSDFGLLVNFSTLANIKCSFSRTDWIRATTRETALYVSTKSCATRALTWFNSKIEWKMRRRTLDSPIVNALSLSHCRMVWERIWEGSGSLRIEVWQSRSCDQGMFCWLPKWTNKKSEKEENSPGFLTRNWENLETVLMRISAIKDSTEINQSLLYKLTPAQYTTF